VVADSGVIDVFDVSLDGAARRLTFARGDDYGASWAPDNSRFVFVTHRWSRAGHYDLAIYDTLTRGVQHLTSGDDTDEGPSWSPDGSRIAFTRRSAAGGYRTVCVVDTDGSHLRCVQRDSTDLGVLGWADPRHVVVGLAVAGATRI